MVDWKKARELLASGELTPEEFETLQRGTASRYYFVGADGIVHTDVEEIKEYDRDLVREVLHSANNR